MNMPIKTSHTNASEINVGINHLSKMRRDKLHDEATFSPDVTSKKPFFELRQEARETRNYPKIDVNGVGKRSKSPEVCCF